MEEKRSVYEGIVTEVTEDTPDRFSFKLKDDNYPDDIQFILTRRKQHSDLKQGMFKIGQKVEIDIKSKAEGEAIMIEV